MRWVAATLLVGVLPVESRSAADEATLHEVQALIATYDEDITRLERARLLLEAATRRDPQPGLIALLSRVWFLIGEVNARTDDQRLAAFDRGREAGRRAIEVAPRAAEAHLWYAINTGRWAETKGVWRSMLLLSKVREEAELVLRLDPESVEGQALAGGLARELPRVLGGDPRRSEEHFRRALATDPRRAAVRVELARLYVTLGRRAEARQELIQALEERAPSDVAYWRLKVEPQARALLESLRQR